MLSNNRHESSSSSREGSTPGFLRIGDTYYAPLQRHNNKHERVTYNVSANAQVQNPGSLVDGGSNGGVAGNDVRVIEIHPHRKIDITGIDNHQMNDVQCATVRGVTNSNIGPALLIMHQYAHTAKGTSIHSPGQWECHGAKIDDKSKRVGGTQSITLPSGVTLPMDFVNGLPRLPMRPFKDEELESLKVIHVTLDRDWDPRTRPRYFRQ